MSGVENSVVNHKGGVVEGLDQCAALKVLCEGEYAVAMDTTKPAKWRHFIYMIQKF